MLTIHHLGISQSDRIVWLCEELGLDYGLKRYDRAPATRLAPADYKKLHEIGTAPVIQDGDLTLGESGAIMEYILGKYGEGRLSVGPAAANYADYLYWFHFANASLMLAVITDLMAAMAAGGEETEARKRLRGRLDRAYAAVERRLSQADYFAGAEFTAADIIMVFPLTTMRLFAPRDLAPYPHIRAYLQRIGERPAYRRAMEKADPGVAPHLT